MSFPGGWAIVTATVDIGSVSANTELGTSVTIAGVETSDWVVPLPPTGLEDDILAKSAVVTASDTVTLKVYNSSGGAVNPAAATWGFLIFRGDASMPVPLG